MKWSSRDLSALEILNSYNKQNLEEDLIEYHHFLDTLIYLHETLADLKISMPEWKVYSDTLMSKFYFHSHTLYKILSGTTVSSKYFNNGKFEQKILDIPSAHVVLRAQLETYLMYNHIYVNVDQESEQELRFCAWIYSSLLERQNFPSNSEFSRARKLEDLQHIKILNKRIQNLKAFRDLSPKQQKALLEIGSDKLFKHWATILKESGFEDESIFHTYYSILSSYAHSEGISILQLKAGTLAYSQKNKQAILAVFLSKLLITTLIVIIKRKYKIIEIKFNTLPQSLQDKIELYHQMIKIRH